MRIHKALLPLALVALLLIGGCASNAKRTDELLLKDYQTMSDVELQSYYYKLNDQIARVEREAREPRFGGGLVTAPVEAEAGADEEQQTVAGDLRDRRNAVRQELSRRGLRK